MGLGTHTDLYPGELLGSQMGDDALNTIVSAGTALGTNSQLSRCQADIIVNNNDIGRIDLVIIGCGTYTFTAAVHISLRF